MIELLENKELKEDFFLKKAILHENSYGTGRVAHACNSRTCEE